MFGAGSCGLVWEPAMPFKANAACRHHIPKQKRKVANWAAYDASLRRREFDSLVQRRGDRGLASRSARDPRRPAHGIHRWRS